MKNIISKAGFVILFIGISSLQAQMRYYQPVYTPTFDYNFQFQNFMMQSMPFRTNYTTVSEVHKFKIVYLDGTDTLVNCKIHADSPAYYLKLVYQSVPKSDSARRYKRVYPAQTKYIVRMDMSHGAEYTGMPSDSCWLFKTISGQMNAYTPLAEDMIQDGFLTYIQNGESTSLIKMNRENLESILKDYDKAFKLARKKQYSRAISEYNRAFTK